LFSPNIFVVISTLKGRRTVLTAQARRSVEGTITGNVNTTQRT